MPSKRWTWLAAALLASGVFATPIGVWAADQEAVTFHVAVGGSDTNDGSAGKPFATLQAAVVAARGSAGKVGRRILLHAGTYHLTQSVVLTPADSGTAGAPFEITAAPNETATLSGGVPLAVTWSPYKNGIMRATVPADVKSIDQLFINGEREPMARYPNFDGSIPIFNGFAPDAISPERVRTWSNPAGGFIHAIHGSRWGSLDYLITGKNPDGTLAMQGGWQTNRPAPMHKQYRYVENVFEELDVPKEWFFNPTTHTLYYYPPTGLDLSKAVVNSVRLENLLEFRGDGASKPVHDIHVNNLTFTQAARTFMETKEPLLRSDWAIARKGAVLFTDAVDCGLSHCTIDQVGGNAIFVNNFNQHLAIDACHILFPGASAICFVGDPKSVRDPLFTYKGARDADAKLDLQPGPLTNNYPQNCTVSNSLIHDIGRVEKQVAGVEIDIASHISVSHCSIYNTPRAGINIGDGCFGGNRIEFCDVFDTVLETNDHGAFNSWGRDRYWSADRKAINARFAENPKLPLLDVVEPNTLTNNRWRCDHGWDVDLDDGSSNYIITNNIMLSGGLKFREGYNRVGSNNILVNTTFHAHVWLNNSHDTFSKNIVMRAYKPVGMPKDGAWGGKVDDNFFSTADELKAAQAFGVDQHSITGDPQFLNAVAGDFRVADNSPAKKIGFENFAMDFGVTDPALKKLARNAPIPTIAPVVKEESVAKVKTSQWMGATVKTVTTDGEVSAAGLPEKSGVILLEVPAASPAEIAKLQKLDVIVQANGKTIANAEALLAIPARRLTSIGVMRNQQVVTLSLLAPLPADFHGYRRENGTTDGCATILVSPKIAAPGNPWLWRATFFDTAPQLDIALLAQGYHIAYIEVGNTFGAPLALAHWDVFYKELTEKHGLSKKPVLEGLSRGGLYECNWAINHPDNVGLIVTDNCVFDFKSWPGGVGKSPKSAKDWDQMKAAYGFQSDAEAMAYTNNPIDRLKVLADHHIPIFVLYADADKAAIPEENAIPFLAKYKTLGGPIDSYIKHGFDHHPHGLDNPTVIVKYIDANARK